MIDNQIIKLISHKGKLGLVIKAPIPASMKKVVYDGAVAFTADELLCSQCNCKSGSQCSDRVACVHTLARAYLLSRLLAEDLAEHMLLELGSMMTSSASEKDTWSSDQINQMKSSIIDLMKASGKESLAKEAGSMNTLFEVLKAYRTGTQCSNEWKRVHTPPRKDEICPIYNLNFDSPEQKAKSLFHLSSKKKEHNHEFQLFNPDYGRVAQVLNVIGCSPSLMPMVGFKLFGIRCMKEQNNRNRNVEDSANDKKEWNSLLNEEGEKRSMLLHDSAKSNI